MTTFHRNLIEKYNHPNISIVANDEYFEYANWLLSYFEDKVRTGVKFQSGETMEVGWSTIMLSQDTQDEIVIYEPDLENVPIEWVIGGNRTLRDFAIQNEMCLQAGVDPSFPSMRQSGIMSPTFLNGNQEFTMVREPPSNNDSGWLFREVDYDEADACLCSLYQIAVSNTAIIPFIALPNGSTVVANNSNIEIKTSNCTISERDNIFLKEIRGSIYLR